MYSAYWERSRSKMEIVDTELNPPCTIKPQVLNVVNVLVDVCSC